MSRGNNNPDPPLSLSKTTVDKDKWIRAEWDRWARYFNVPTVSAPPKFPALTLAVMRAICAVGVLAAGASSPTTTTATTTTAATSAQEAIVRATDAFYEAYWGQARDITDASVVEDVLGRIVVGLQEQQGLLTVAKVLETAGAQGKAVLLANTEEAFRQGAFGLPWMVCENDEGQEEGFWGVDHLGVMLDFLGIEKPRTGPWKALL